MYLLSVACISGCILGISTLSVARQGSIATFSDPISSPSSSFELLYPSNESTSWSNESFTAAHPPSLAANSSALQALGLNGEGSITWLTAPSGNAIGVHCNVEYGRRLDFLDCRDAHTYIPRSDQRPMRFAWRNSGLPHDNALPLRALGSKGRCAIDLVLVEPYETAKASAQQISEAAHAVIFRCAPRSGGIAVNIGGDNHLSVTVSSYAPTVRCEGPNIPFRRESCSAIERGMQADEKQVSFGDRHFAPGVEEELPYEMIASDAACAVQLSSSANEDHESWYHLWEATVALNAMCVRVGMKGKATRLGAQGKLSLDISNRPFSSSPPLGLVNDTAMSLASEE